VTSRDTSADAFEDFMRAPRHGGDDFSRGVTRRSCPFPPDSSAALSWLRDWDTAAEKAAWVLNQRDAGHLRDYARSRDLLLDIGRFLRDLRGSKAISAHRALHRDLEGRLQDLLNVMPAGPEARSS
jgi:hypothetical protein